jgi:hypothetical protein
MTKVSGKKLKPSIKAKLSKLNSSRSFKHSRFSRANLTIFTIIFAAIGCYFLFFSHAATLVGDINSDGTVDATDFSFLVSSFGQATHTCTSNSSFTCDLNNDNKVDFLDVSVLISNWGQAVTVTVSPSSAAVLPGGTQQFSASVNNATNQSVTWSVQEGASGGTINSSGLYTAPATQGTYHVVATSVAFPGKSSSVNVTVGTTYTLPSDRSYDWKPGLNAVGGIPNRTTISKTISPSGADDTAAIQSALDSCPANGVVQLAAGTFKISGQGLFLENSNCTLRGAGPGNGNPGVSGTQKTGTGTGTFLVKTLGSNYPVISIGPQWGGTFGTRTNLTADAAKGSKSVTVASTTGISAGSLVILNELTDSNISHWNSQDPENASGWFEEANRPLGETMEVASVSGNTITFTTPLPIGYQVSQTAHLFPETPVTKSSGLEDLYLYGGEGGDGGGGIHIWNCDHCWVKHVEDTWSIGAAIHIDQSFGVEIRDSYFHNSQNGLFSGGANYGIGLNWYSSNILLENNISIKYNKDIVMRSAGGGNVVSYNYMDDGADSGGQWQETVINSSHMTTPHYVLFEGNEGADFDQDDRWGNSVYNTIFRNHLIGFNRDYAQSGPNRAIGVTQWHWWQSFVGNTLGSPGETWANTYEAINPTNWGGQMWMVCWQNNDNVPDGGKCLSTILRDGNYDYLSKKVHWHGIGGTGVNNGLTPPANSALPTSMYLTNKPAFFGTSTWPWVDGTNASNPLPGQLPARVRYDAGTYNAVP